MATSSTPYQIGDVVKLTIGTGSNVAGTLGATSDAMQVTGTIVEDRGENWLVELTVSKAGKNRILVPKSAFG